MLLTEGEPVGDKLGEEIYDPQGILNLSTTSEKDTALSTSSNDKKDSSPILTHGVRQDVSRRVSCFECSFCGAGIISVMMNQHMIKHIEGNHSLLKLVPRSSKNNQSTDLTKAQTSTHTSQTLYSSSPKKVPTLQELQDFFNVNKVPDPKVKPVERFKFKGIYDVSWFSTTSTSTRYSDFLLTVWLKERLMSYNTHYTGNSGNSNTYRTFDRLNIHVSYDSIEHYYTIQTKLLKKSAYSSTDQEENLVPDRICDQNELMIEIKRILLYYQVPPRSVCKRLLKEFRKGQAVVAEKKDEIMTVSSYSTNFLKLQEMLKNYSDSTHTHRNSQSAYNEEGYYGV